VAFGRGWCIPNKPPVRRGQGRAVCDGAQVQAHWCLASCITAPLYHSWRLWRAAAAAFQVWTASERVLAAADAASGAPLFSLPEAGGFVKAMLPSGWAVWVGGAGGVQAVAARAGWEDARAQVRALGRRVVASAGGEWVCGMPIRALFARLARSALASPPRLVYLPPTQAPPRLIVPRTLTCPVGPAPDPHRRMA
jgi:hypothetical protein